MFEEMFEPLSYLAWLAFLQLSVFFIIDEHRPGPARVRRKVKSVSNVKVYPSHGHTHTAHIKGDKLVLMGDDHQHSTVLDKHDKDTLAQSGLLHAWSSANKRPSDAKPHHHKIIMSA